MSREIHFSQMALCKSSFFSILLQITALLVGVDGQCQLQNGDVPAVLNGYRSNVDNLQAYSDGTAVGFYDVACKPGFALDSSIGERITCLSSGQWSDPLPQCTFLGSCPVKVLFDYIQSGPGVKLDQSQSFIFTDGVDDSQALGGSNITLQCQDGYTNVGGSLTIVCTDQNTWTPFPQCASTSTASATTQAPVRCPYTNGTLTFPNGYVSQGNNLFFYSDQTADGSMVVSCSPGYLIDSISGGVFSCNAGVWSPHPSCIKTARCSRQEIQRFLDDPERTRCSRILSENISVENEDDDAVIEGSTISFACKEGFSVASGNLNISCNGQGQWEQLPSCLADPTTANAA